MHFFVIRVIRSSQDKSSKAASEAYVSCWINDPDRDSALGKATDQIIASGWSSVAVVEDHRITREDYHPKREGLKYYEQALLDGEVLVFFVPKGQ